MTKAVHIFTPRNPLAATLVKDCGHSGQELVAQAESRAHALAEATLSVVRGYVRRLVALRPAPGEGVADIRAVADAAMGVAELAEAAHRAVLGDAARSALALLAAPGLPPQRLGEALNVHITTIEFLAGAPEPPPAEQAALLDRLVHLVSHLSTRPSH